MCSLQLLRSCSTGSSVGPAPLWSTAVSKRYPAWLPAPRPLGQRIDGLHAPEVYVVAKPVCQLFGSHKQNALTESPAVVVAAAVLDAPEPDVCACCGLTGLHTLVGKMHLQDSHMCAHHTLVRSPQLCL
eukprot:350982-Chlamydomonas_euryale.AAC.3